MAQHWEWVLKTAQDLHKRTQSLSVADRVLLSDAFESGVSGVRIPDGQAVHENKLLLTLMNVLPSDIKRPLLEGRPNSSPSSVELLHQTYEWFSPGGKEDCRSLLDFVRRPGSNSSSVSGCRAHLRLWRTARSRLNRLGMSQPPATELLIALEEVLAPMERKFETLRFALQNARLSHGVRQPTASGIAEFEKLAEQELLLLDQDERVRVASSTDVRVASAADAVKVKPCHFFNKPGGCNRNPCPFAHIPREKSTPDKPSPKPKPKPKPKAKPKPSPKREDGQHPNAKPKADPKAKAKAAAAKADKPVVEIITSMMQVSPEAATAINALGPDNGSGGLPWVLVDSGANQILRPWNEQAEKDLEGAAPLLVTLASGEQRQGWRTVEGEVMLPKQSGNDHQHHPWILPVTRLVKDLGYQVVWSESGAELISPHGKHIQCHSYHDLPYIRWKDFIPIRRQLAHKYRSRNATVNQADASSPCECDSVDAECVLQDASLWLGDCESSIASVRKVQMQAVESLARTLLPQCEVSKPSELGDFLEMVLRELPYKSRHVRRDATVLDGGRCNSIVFGLYQHGGFIGLTTATYQLPETAEFINAVLARQLPENARWTSVQIGMNTRASPHRDTRNTGPSYLRSFGEFSGGRLWVQDSGGDVDAVIHGVSMTGSMHSTYGHWLKLDAKGLYHAVEQFVGTRVSVSVYVTGSGKLVTSEMGQVLERLKFRVPETHAGSHNPSRVATVQDVVQTAPEVTRIAFSLIFPSQVPCSQICKSAVPLEEEPPVKICFGPLAGPSGQKDEHARCGHTPARPDCEACQESLGLRRMHRKVSIDTRTTAVLSLDVTGPHPKALETEATYALVAVAALSDGLNLVYVVPLKDKTSLSVLPGTMKVLSMLRSLYGGFLPIAQIHSDCEGEFLSTAFRRAMLDAGLKQTTTQPGDPSQNGRTERYIGLTKTRTIAMLQEGRLPLTLWSHVMVHAAFLLRQSALSRDIPAKYPAPGDCVLVPAKSEAVREGGDFIPKVRYGVFLGVDESIPDGAVVAVREGSHTSFLHVSGPKKWRSPGIKRWRMHAHPNDGSKAVWISSEGDVVWTAPHRETILSFEERRPADSTSDVGDYVRKGFPGWDAQRHYNLFTHSCESPDEHGEVTDVPQGGVEVSWFEIAGFQAGLVKEAANGDDVWKVCGDYLVRRHLTPRVGMFVPVEDDMCPSPNTTLCPPRVTVVLTEEGQRQVLFDRWVEGVPDRPAYSDHRKWRGVTLFRIIKSEAPRTEVAEGAEAVPAAMVQAFQPQEPKSKDRYWLPDPDAQVQMHRMDQVAECLETDALVNVSVDPREAERADESERARWEDGIRQELGNLDAMEVMERVTEEDLRKRRANGEKIPRPLPSKLVLVKKPQPEAAEGEGGYKYKARIVVCGNMQAEAAKEIGNRSEVPDAFFTRCLFTLALLRWFSFTILDVNAAFLYAGLPEGDPAIVVAPPALLRRWKLAGQTEMWVLKKALYGLRASPRQWARERNNTVRNKKIRLSDVEVAMFAPADVHEHVWVLKSTKRGIVAYALFYVDDILVAAQADVLHLVRRAIKEWWKVKDQGTLINPKDPMYQHDLHDELNPQAELGFLGMRLSFVGEFLACHQIPYLKSCLGERKFGDIKGSQSLPAVTEGGEPEFEDRNCDRYRELVRACQKEVGALLWASQRSRPDIAAVIGVLGSQLVVQPTKVLGWCHQVWRYLANTVEIKLMFRQSDASAISLSVSADASFAAGGDRSRSGVAALLCGQLVQWSSVRQSLAAASAVEAEIQAAGLGSVTAIAVLNLVRGLLDEGSVIETELLSDNTGCIANITHAVTSWRNRHYCVKAAALRDQLQEHSIALRYCSGKLILADALTKILGRQALEIARAALRLA
ncbi:TY1B-NL2 [Symbiodinium natans]|uniref:TY1B-NL2 protein n=1 Tax=Symbiodinium natans TaxID=878477 RepID=A0A812KS27_9DINO|nr:TY1B-NL2 [Symbiodinium natans]